MLSRRPLAFFVALLGLFGLLVQPLLAGPPRYRIIDLTERAPVQQSEARGVNARGEIVGFELLEDYQAQAVFWDVNQVGSLLPRLKGDNSNYAYAINEDGIVSGLSQLVTVEHSGDHDIIHYDSKASTWLDGDITRLVGDNLELRWAAAANDDGVVVGVATVPDDNFYHGFIFDQGIATEITGFPEGARGAQPHAVNQAGTVVGEFFHAGGTHAFLWDNGVGIDLHDDPLIHGVTSRAYKINGSGQVVGEAQFSPSNPEIPVLWDNGVAVDLVGQRFHRPQGIATSINNAGQIVGFATDLDDLNSPFDGFLIEGGTYASLLDLIPQDEGWQFLLAWDINDAGWIVGGGMRNGQLGHAWLMIPND